MLSLLKIALVVLILCAGMLFFLQDGMIYYPRANGAGPLAELAGLGGVSLPFETVEGKQVAYYLPPERDPEEAPGSLWLLCGGNAALTLDYLDVAVRAGRNQGYLFVDFPSYGPCEGSPTPKSTKANADGALTALADHLGTSEAVLKPRFSAFGHSLGAAVVLRAAADWEMKRAVVVAPFTSMMDFARQRFGFPLCQILRHRYDNRASLRVIATHGGKVTIFHGVEDTDVPVANGQTLAAEFPGTVEFYEIPGADHNTIVFEIADRIAAAMRLIP
jgi:pimeloyl-ACP methyl ester carboxylesterase